MTQPYKKAAPQKMADGLFLGVPEGQPLKGSSHEIPRRKGWRKGLQLHHAVKINHILMAAPYPPAPQGSACGGGRASGAPFSHAGHPLSLSGRETFSRCPNPSPRTRPKRLSGRVSIWLCYSLWLFYLHSAVKIQPFYPVFPLAGATAKAFFRLSIWNFKEKSINHFL